MNRIGRVFSSRGMAAFLFATIGPLSAWLLVLNSTLIYFEYYLYPRIKAVDGYYYPQWRYTIFDVVLVAWCVDGSCIRLALALGGLGPQYRWVGGPNHGFVLCWFWPVGPWSSVRDVAAQHGCIADQRMTVAKSSSR